MSTPILATKLYIPPSRPKIVLRSHLIERLNEGLHRKLTLISAPVGYGKTTLVSDWLSKLDIRAAWLSLDPEDDEPRRFWAYMVAALQTVQPELGLAVLAMLQAPQLPPIENLLSELINQIITLSDKIILVLDDYHHLTSSSLHQGLNFFLDHLPPQMHLVIITREDLALPLSQMRVKGQMNELRAKDLRFTMEESTQFLNQQMRLNLRAEEIATLGQRTEGWVAGLQMAALSLQNVEDTASFVEAFTGDDRYVVDYLIGEVIERQPEHIQEFLLQTAILKRFTASLCDAVTEQHTGRENLTFLEEMNLFLIPLDNKRLWYRYHQLFSDLLQYRLRDKVGSEGIKQLQLRAVDWYEESGLITEAIEHALSGEDFDRAGNLIEQGAMTTLFEHTQWATLLRWMELLPAEIATSQPQLNLTFAWALFTTGRWEKVEPFLQNVELTISTYNETDERIGMLGEVATIRALAAYENGAMSRCHELAIQALDYLPEDNLFIRCVAILAQGMANLWLNNSKKSRRALHDAFTLSQSAGNTTVILAALGYLAQLEVKQGHLKEAAKYYDQARRLGTDKEGRLLGPTGLACVQMGEVLREWNELDQAKQILVQGVELSEQQTGMPEYVFEGLITLARVQIAIGDEQNVDETIQRAEILLTQLRQRSGDIEPIISLALDYRARLWLEMGNLEAAGRWLSASGIHLGEELISGRERVYVLLARTLIAQERFEEATSLLHRLFGIEEIRNTTQLAVECLSLQALAMAAVGKQDRAEKTLMEALGRAESEGYIRLFVSGGEIMVSLLNLVLRKRKTTAYVEILRGAISSEMGRGEPRVPYALQSLAELLTDQELRVLRLMDAGLSHAEIASELYLSINTVKWHATHIYSKLGVNRRAHAVSQARELGII